ncbi:hypothetical protein WJX74_000268 [Apatococcus lobatus]|uniref:Sulfotransferase n=2 Tax=Apatococcus TaxID=904362 RepID=A0AAW1T8V6_9CHLO
MHIGRSRIAYLLALALALLASCDLTQAQLKFTNFTTSQIKKCPASGKAKPPNAQRVNINGLPFSGAPWLKELLEEVIAAACTSPAYKDHCKARDPCVEHLGYLHCTYFGSNLVVPFQYNNSAVRRGWFQSGPGWPFSIDRSFIHDCLRLEVPIDSDACKRMPTTKRLAFDHTTTLMLQVDWQANAGTDGQQVLTEIWSLAGRYVHLVRDPRDMVYAWALNETRGQNLDKAHELIRQQSKLAVGWWTWWHYWYSKRVSHYMEVLVVRYEDLVRHPYRELSRLSNFLGLCVIDEQMKQIASRVRKGDSREGPMGEYLDALPPDILEFFNSSMYRHMPRELATHYLGKWRPPPKVSKGATSARNSKAGRRRERRAEELQASHAATKKQFEAEAEQIKAKMLTSKGAIPDV